ncbi:hypothetical protein BIW11_13938 [Tropilaelaps mercedesae]|uniref:Uncharacterized protein n=1 Tax=Tropilaelaps mercedesae TaxID=418985 RepID=A0A1V9X028_9ACAR|nr:hypothetical protein BIW11_13938 [Tropilaelaps mercedesae]
MQERKVVEERQREWKKYHEYGTLSSPLSGLVIQLNTEVNEYLPTSLDVGFVAMIHEHNKDYSICQDSIYVLPGYTTYIGLSLATTQNLEPPYQDGCRKEWPKELKEGNFEANVKVMDPLVVTQQYSRAMCLEYCKIEYLIFKCKCIQNNPAVKIHQDLTENYKYCKTLRKQNCTEMELAGKTNIDWQLRCDCRRECEMQRYSTDVSVAGLIAENSEIPESQNDTAKLFVDMSSARLVVYFHSFTYEHIKAIRKYDEIRLLSNIGGINGMYLGLSFYLLFQALDIIISGAIQFVQKLRSAKFTFGQDGNQKSSIAVQTSDCADRRRRNAAPYIYPASESTPETPFYVGQMKNIWDVFEKPSGNNSYNTTEQFKTTHGSFAFRYNKK